MRWTLAASLAWPGLADCTAHASRSQCIAFRHQDNCAWDVARQLCVPQTPCEERSRAVCERELTTDAAWDDTQNLCFWDPRLETCRWSQDCFGHSVQACRAAACEWQSHCTPADMASAPGPHVCSESCGLPRASTALTGRPPRPRRPSRRPGSTAVVETSTGPVRGNRLPGALEFLGIPFARAPLEELRWAPARQMSSWNQVFEATAFSAACPQPADYYKGSKRCQGRTQNGCLGYSEDCLSLNIWTPSTKGARAVLFWIHGGCYVYGSAADAEYNGTRLAQEQDVVLVSVQYRLGVFGFLGASELRARDPRGSTGNYGLMDNLAALRWVKANIASFGGDPERVTIFGESSGAGSVSLLLGVQEAWPYYQQAIMESGTASFWTYLSLEAASENWHKALQATRCTSVDCLVNASQSALSSSVAAPSCRDGCSWAPVLDGVFLRGTPLQLAAQGALRPETPIISGFNRNDGAMFVTGYPSSMLLMSEASMESYFKLRYGEERALELQKLFEPEKIGWWSSYFQAAQACETDFSYSCTAQWLSSHFKVSYVYEFAVPGLEGLTLHGDEIEYIFGTLSEGEDEVSAWMMHYWSSFAKTGDPNGAAAPVWPRWQSNASVLKISKAPEVTTAPGDSWPGCGFFSEHWDFYSLCLPPEGQRALVV